MTALLDAAAERGYPLSALYPATMPIYRSLGWELAGGKYVATIPARSLRTLVAPDPAAQPAMPTAPAAAGARRLPRSAGPGPNDAAEVIAVIGRAHAAARDAGPLTWDEGPTRQWLSRPDLYSYLAGDDGYAAYRWDADGHPNLLVERVHAVTPESLRALWSVIASHSSVARTVTALTAPSDPFWWLTAERDATISKRSMWMLRVVDAPAAIAARGFPPGVSVSVPLTVHDQARPANAGRWQLTVADGKGALVSAGTVGKPTPPSSPARPFRRRCRPPHHRPPRPGGDVRGRAGRHAPAVRPRIGRHPGRRRRPRRGLRRDGLHGGRLLSTRRRNLWIGRDIDL